MSILKTKFLKVVSLILVTAMAVTGCTPASSETEEAGRVSVKKHLIKVGFAQTGSESDWRKENSQSINMALTQANGYQLFFEDAKQKQSNQAMAIRRFIQQRVNYIVLAPITELGWENVLREAKDSNIPVIIVDRQVQVDDESLYACHIGSDFRLEGDKVTAWLATFCRRNGIDSKDIHIAHIRGSEGASAQIGRTLSLEKAAKRYRWNIEAREDGDFTQAKGKEVMTRMIAQNPDINVVYCENDEMALGAIEAIEAAGRKTGSDIKNGQIMILSFDGVSDEAMEKLLERKISCIGECYPMHGPYVQAAIEMLNSGQRPDRETSVSEGIYSADSRITQVTVGKKDYPVTIVTKEWLESR